MESLSISDYMNQRPVKLHVDMPVAEAVELLLQSKQAGGPVVDSENMVVGFLSEQDCLSQMITSSYYREQVCRVGDIMQKDVLTTKPYHSILNLAQQMLNAKPKIYPVVDDDGLLVGAINRSDILHAIDIQLRSGYAAKAS